MQAFHPEAQQKWTCFSYNKNIKTLFKVGLYDAKCSQTRWKNFKKAMCSYMLAPIHLFKVGVSNETSSMFNWQIFNVTIPILTYFLYYMKIEEQLKSNIKLKHINKWKWFKHGDEIDNKKFNELMILQAFIRITVHTQSSCLQIKMTPRHNIFSGKV